MDRGFLLFLDESLGLWLSSLQLFDGLRIRIADWSAVASVGLFDCFDPFDRLLFFFFKLVYH